MDLHIETSKPAEELKVMLTVELFMQLSDNGKNTVIAQIKDLLSRE